ncbi:heavy metal translocating P-type ATPase [Gracilimonas mengyeensis]|uniref:P-type Zn(2+) transporter n=1 Tax=Gracilimonas mengyeensis TaxID=1302730 RepID=A0A521CZI4_9BACT|nr:heavy metal translocating P-type ATPase [Gracilimonas mengyeensis]SMO64161.1 Cd2+/Zn2+-exporting ATPase [Gracilimonas mengyeensis]
MEFLKKYYEVAWSSVFLVAALLVQYGLSFEGQAYVYLPLFLASYLFVGIPVWIKAFKSIRKGTIFSEFLLMGIATVGAFVLGEYAEGVAVMLFYMIGEYAQGNAVRKARGSIEALINQQPDVALVERNGQTEQVHPSEVQPGEIIQVKPGEKVPLDGELVTNKASFNTAALTGESKPMTREQGEEIWAGSINELVPVRIKVTKAFKDSRLSDILNMVQEATQRKAPTQRFMTRFAKVYTPIVVWLAVALTFLPWLFVDTYVFEEWFYRALIFLVVSCPCGLVISIPLGYFGGIGAASQNGILLKGSDYLDQLRKMKTLFLDKTGTLTEGSFEVQDVITHNGLSDNEVLVYAASLEQQSTHPIGQAILNFKNGQPLHDVENQEEISGKGLKGLINQKEVLVGNRELLEKHGVKLSGDAYSEPYTYVHVAVGGEHAGTITIADRIKKDSQQAIRQLREKGVERLVMLSGDNQEVASHVAAHLGLDEAYGGLLPDDKYNYVKEALQSNSVTGFVGDGLNDAPVITLADVGIAMGGIGSDAAIETADVVIQTDHPSKIAQAVDIANFTHKIVWQNIGFALGIKVLVMGLATVGIATMWEAIFADVGVALIAIANAIRVQRKFAGDEKTNLLDFFKKDPNPSSEKPAACCETCSV